jgi:hypothetical protein
VNLKNVKHFLKQLMVAEVVFKMMICVEQNVFNEISLFFQYVLFYVLTDDVEWAEKTLINHEKGIYYVGSKENSTIDGLSLSKNDQIGELYLLSLCYIFCKEEGVPVNKR